MIISNSAFKNGRLIRESEETDAEVQERLNDLDDSEIYDNDINQGLTTEATGLYKITANDPPEDFKKTVIKAFETGEKMAENKYGVGEGMAAAFFGKFYKLFNNSLKSVECLNNNIII